MDHKDKAPYFLTDPVRLHLELKDDYLSPEQKVMLKRYGESISGDSISRDILVPSDMPLHNLHYAIQKLFGWQNSHLRCFELPEADYLRLTSGTVKGWAALVGDLFQPPAEGESDIFWDDDYKSGSINTWLKKKYSGPYIYKGIWEDPQKAKSDIQELFDHFPLMNVRESFDAFQKGSSNSEKSENREVKIIKSAPLMDLTLEEMNSSLILENGTTHLLERLEVDEVLAAQDETINPEELFPVTKELLYTYDYGVDWTVSITKYPDCSDLLKDHSITEAELAEAKETVLTQYRPVCIHRIGMSVLDDVSGLSGFADMLQTYYEGEDQEEQSSCKIWAKGQGWSDKKKSIKTML